MRTYPASSPASSHALFRPHVFIPLVAVLFFVILLSALIFVFHYSYQDVLGAAVGLVVSVAPLFAVIGWATYYRYQASLTRGWFISRLLLAAERNAPLVGALEAIEKDSGGLPLRIARRCRNELLRGGSLANALKHFSRIFSPLHISLIAIGEKSGRLAEALRAVRRHHESLSKARNRLITHLLYPLWIGFFMAGIAAFMRTYVRPMFEEFGAEFESEFLGLRLSAARFFGLADPAAVISFLMILCVFGLLTTGYRLPRPLRTVADNLKWYLPFFRQYELRTGLAIFANTVCELLSVGIPFHRACETASELEVNPRLRRRLQGSVDLLKEGTAASEAFSEKRGYPSTFTWAIAVGERSGNMASMLSKIGSSFARRIEFSMNRAIEFVFPASILILGGVAFLFGASVYGFLRQLMDALEASI